MSVTTKKGDDGSTKLPKGREVSKSDRTVELLGDLDELNSYIGLVLATAEGLNDYELLVETQHMLFDLGAWVANDDYNLPEGKFDELTAAIEEIIKLHEEETPEIKSFILPGGTETSAHLHVARAIARRAERTLSRYNEFRTVPAAAKRFINRVSDWLFMAARRINSIAERPEIVWNKKES